MNQPTVHYAYRYFLPFGPDWCDLSTSRQRLKELLDFCRGAGIDAVQLYVNTLPGTYYMPKPSAAGQQAEADWIRDEAFPALRAQGISPQLNLQMILGAVTMGYDLRPLYDWEFLVDQHGRQALGCPCPMGPRFRRAMGAILRLWAGCGADVLWIDDDFRLHNHGNATPGIFGTDHYCFCDLHLDAFRKRIERPVTREELLAEVLRPGEPSPMRRQWLEFLNDTHCDAAGWIEQEIHAVAPGCRIGLMTSLPDVHSSEGRDWKKLLTRLSGPHRPLTRPCCGIYTGTTVAVKENALSYRTMAQSIAAVEATLGRGICEFAPEVENTRYTTWAKSAANTRFAVTLAAMLGGRHITLAMHDLDGSPISEEPTIQPLLRDLKPHLQALIDLDVAHWQPQGVVLLTDERAAERLHVGQKADYSALSGRRQWDDLLLQHGIPCCYLAPAQVQPGQVLALDGYSAWMASDEQVRSWLSTNGMLLDAEAASVLQQRGFGDLLGVAMGGPQPFGALAEVYHGDVLEGVHGCRVPHRGSCWRAMTLQGAKLLSQFVDATNARHPGSAVHPNRSGGHVAVYAHSGELSWGLFGSHARMRWLRALIKWLGGSNLFLPHLPHHGLVVQRQGTDRLFYAVANLGTDPLPADLVRPDTAARWLDEAGQWQTSSKEPPLPPFGWRLHLSK